MSTTAIGTVSRPPSGRSTVGPGGVGMIVRASEVLPVEGHGFESYDRFRGQTRDQAPARHLPRRPVLHQGHCGRHCDVCGRRVRGGSEDEVDDAANEEPESDVHGVGRRALYVLPERDEPDEDGLLQEDDRAGLDDRIIEHEGRELVRGYRQEESRKRYPRDGRDYWRGFPTSPPHK